MAPTDEPTVSTPALRRERGYRNNCIKVLKEAELRITKTRLAVIDCLAGSNTPLSAPQIFQSITENCGQKDAATNDSASSKKARVTKQKKQRIDKVSVYRVLETLTAHALVHRVGPTGAYIACSHLDCESYYHVISRCKECHNISELDVPKEVVAPLLFHLKNSLFFSPDSHLLHMDGVCAHCGG